MKSKQVISLSIAFAFLALSLTGILLYIKQKTHEIEITHTVFGLCFIGFAIFHIINNWGSIRGYSYEKLKSAWSKEIKIVGIAFVVLLVGGATGLLEPVAELGRIFAPSRPRMEDLNFNKISTNGTLDQGSTWSISLEMDRSGFLPVVAVWAEDSSGQFLENIFVPTKIALPEEAGDLNDVKLMPFEPSTLPTWSTRTKDHTPNYPEETPRTHFIINTKLRPATSLVIRVEVKNKDLLSNYELRIDPTLKDIFRLVPGQKGPVKKIIVQSE